MPLFAIAADPAPSPASASTVAENSGYNLPPKAILDVMLAPTPPVPIVSPTHDRLLLMRQQWYASIARVSTPYVRLAGVRIETRNHSKHDTPGGYGVTLCATEMGLVQVKDGTTVPIRMTEPMCAARPMWNADGTRFAFANTATDSVELWVGDGKTGEVRRVPNARLNPMYGAELQWMPDQKSLLVELLPEHLGAPPAESSVPSGPSIQESDGKTGQSSTYELRDTLKDRHDEDLFDYYGQAQVALIDAVSLATTKVGRPGLYASLDPAPDDRHLLVATIHKPYSYVTTYDNFPEDVDVWDISRRTDPASAHIASIPLHDRVPIAGVPTGPREFSWRATQPATLIWAEALDGGDWKVKVPERDKLMTLKAPFTEAPAEFERTEQRLTRIVWGEEGGRAMLVEYDEPRHWRKTTWVDVDDPHAPKKVLWDMSSDEKYANPGLPVLRELPNGQLVLREAGDAIFMSGVGSSPDGDRPFLDRFDLKTLKSERLFRSSKTAFERFLAFTGPTESTFLTWHQTVEDPPNAFVRTLAAPSDAQPGEASFASTSIALTHLPDPTPEVRQIKKRLVRYKRADGLDLSFTLYTPPGYQEGTRVPTILYAYPLDYAGASQAGQTTGSQQTFTYLFEYRLLLLAGYAILDNASFPVVGDPTKAYDTFLPQLLADAKAAIDEGVRIGVVDPDRVGVTGHSHGALMTANLVAHSDLFRAGIATSGSYNKTLTPFGFQSERRSVWEAQDVYLNVSPFFFADKIKTPLLLVHGAEDANPGTTPLQSEKLYEAIRGNGGTTRLVMLPHEPHWYTALESNEQLLYEMVRWFDKYVKNAPPRVTDTPPAASGGEGAASSAH